MQQTLQTIPVREPWESVRSARPSFSGLVRGELFKIRNQRVTWALLVLVGLLVLFPYLLTYLSLSPATLLQKSAFDYFCAEMAGVERAGTGLFLLILTARVIGLEYQLGTIRVLLARGVGRLQLLFAKLTAVGLVALFLLLGCLVLNMLFVGVLLAAHGRLDLLSQIGSHLALYGLTVVISAVVSVLLAAALTVLGRSLAFGLSASIAFFPLDNFGALLLPLGYRLTHATFWLQITAYLLGPNLNQMSAALTRQDGFNFGFGPAVAVDGTHTMLVVLVYALISVAIAVWLTVKRDVHE